MSNGGATRMSYEEACKVLGYRISNNNEEAVRLAKARLNAFTKDTPLRFKAACNVIIEASKGENEQSGGMREELANAPKAVGDAILGNANAKIFLKTE